MALLPKEQAAVAEARKRGLSQQKIDTFLAENPGDYSRLKDQQPDAVTGKPAAAPKSMGAAPGAAPAPMSAPASVVGLGAATGAPEAAAPGSMPMFVPQEPSGPGMMASAQGALRPGMGMRQPPVPNMALAALKRVY